MFRLRLGPRHSAAISIGLVAAIACASAAQGQTITGLSVSSLAQAGRLKITGSAFGQKQGMGTVMVGGAVAPVTRWSSTSITAYVSDAAPLGVDQVQVLTHRGSSNALPLTVTARHAAGRVAWRFQADDFYIRSRPGVAPDGTVYALDVGGHLYALTPQGGVKWIFNTTPAAIQAVEVGPGGTVYFASGDTVFAVHPDGSLKWKARDPSGAPVGAGPTVGPDGNIYAVSEDAGLAMGLGAMTLSPEGEVLRHHPGYVTGRGDDQTREIAFGPTQFYFVMNNTIDQTNGLQFFELGGDFLFAILAGGSDEQPAVGANGRIYSSMASNQMGEFDTQGHLLDSSVLGSLTAPHLGADGTIYVGADLDVLALHPHLGTKWSHHIRRGAYFGGGPVVDPTNTMVVVGVSDIGAPGFIRGIDAATGKRSWQVELPAENGGYVRTMSRARFSGPDRAYFGTDVNDSVAEPYSYLYAIDAAPDFTAAQLPQ